jgi:aminopeptidase-like protein
MAIALKAADGVYSLLELAKEMKLPQVVVNHTVARFRVAGLIELIYR